MLYLLFGDDEFACHEALAKLRSAAGGDPSLADLNCTLLDGKKLSLSELRHHCDAIPFLADRRLVIVEGLATRVDGRGPSRKDSDEAADAEGGRAGAKALLDELLAYFPHLPDSTDLILLDAGFSSKNSRGRIARWAGDHPGQAQVREYPQKRPDELARWIRERVRDAGGQIDPQATRQLTSLVGSDTRTLTQEIEKLILYVGTGRPIGVDDVHRLVPHSREASIFALVDAISQGQGASAIAGLRRLLEEGAHPLYVLTMIHNQFSMIVQAKALLDERLRPPELARRLGVSEYPAKKAGQLASRYTDRQLVATYDSLLQTDLRIKTGKMEPALAVETLIAELQVATVR